MNRLKALINEATYQIPDGVGILIASRLKGGIFTHVSRVWI